MELVAARLRLFGHPTRLRVVRVLHERDATLVELGDELGIDPGKVGAQVRLLYAGGVICRTDDGSGGPARYGLVDWPGWWLIEQLAARLRAGAHPLRELADADEGASC